MKILEAVSNFLIPGWAPHTLYQSALVGVMKLLLRRAMPKRHVVREEASKPDEMKKVKRLPCLFQYEMGASLAVSLSCGNRRLSVRLDKAMQSLGFLLPRSINGEH